MKLNLAVLLAGQHNTTFCLRRVAVLKSFFLLSTTFIREDDYRKFIRTPSDQELIKAGKRLRILCGDVVTPTPSTFDRQLEICREEYRRRQSHDWLEKSKERQKAETKKSL